jgi:hypothetical protein
MGQLSFNAWEKLEQTGVGTDAQCTLFKTLSDLPTLDLSLTWCLDFSVLSHGVEGGTLLLQDIAAQPFFYLISVHVPLPGFTLCLPLPGKAA